MHYFRTESTPGVRQMHVGVSIRKPQLRGHEKLADNGTGSRRIKGGGWQVHQASVK